MMTSTIERAFALARGGSCRSIDDLRKRLTAEGHTHVETHLGGTAIRKQLKQLMGAREAGCPASPPSAAVEGDGVVEV